MFEQVRDTLSAAIDELAIPVDAGALAECVALLDRFTAKVLDGVGAFDAAEGWRDAGALHMTSWLRTAGCSRAQAHNLARTARRLAGLPATAAAYRDGTLSTGQVQAIVANLSDRVAPLFADAEADLVPTLAAMPVPDVSATMQTWAQAAHDSLTAPDPAPEPAVRRRLHLSRTLDGRRELSGSFDPEAGLLAEAALRVARTDDLDGEPERNPAHRRADALVDILRFYLDHQDATPTGTRHRPHLNVFLDYDDLVHAAQTTHAAQTAQAAQTAHAAQAAQAAQAATTATTGAHAAHAVPIATTGAVPTDAEGSATKATAGWPPGGPIARPAVGWTAGGTVRAATTGAVPTDAEGSAAKATGNRWPPGGPVARPAIGWPPGGPIARPATGWAAGGTVRAATTSAVPTDAEGSVARAVGGWTADGTVLDAATILRLACDAGVHRVITKGRSAILDYGTTSRVVPAHLFQALVARDKHCRFGDCDVPADRCDAHHVQHWGQGGPTEIGNLVLACWGHHHRLHEPGWHAELRPDATFVVTGPDGRTIGSRPPGRPPTLFQAPGGPAVNTAAPPRPRGVLSPRKVWSRSAGAGRIVRRADGVGRASL